MSTHPFEAPAESLQGGMACRPTWVRYRVLALLAVAAAVAYVTRNAVGVAESTIRQDLGLTLRQSGWFMGAFFWSYALLQVPGGWLAHRYGTKLAMFVFAAAWSAAALCIGMAGSLWLLVVAQLMMGAAQAGIFPAACHSIAHWISLPRRTLACGWLTMGMQVGAIAAAVLTGPLIVWIGWRSVFLAYSVPGFLCAAVFLVRFCNHPSSDPQVNRSELQLIQAGKTAANVAGRISLPRRGRRSFEIRRSGFCAANRFAAHRATCFLPVGFPPSCRRREMSL